MTSHCIHKLPLGLQPIGYFPPHVALRCCNCGLSKHRVEIAVRPEKHGAHLPHPEWEIWPGPNPYEGDECPGDTSLRTTQDTAQTAKQETKTAASRVSKGKKRSTGEGEQPLSDQDADYLLDLRDRGSPRDSARDRRVIPAR